MFFESLQIFPISEVLYVQRDDETIGNKWRLIDVYKIGPGFDFEISLFGLITASSGAHERLKVTHKFQSKLTRKNLKGLKLTCGLVVCIFKQIDLKN